MFFSGERAALESAERANYHRTARRRTVGGKGVKKKLQASCEDYARLRWEGGREKAQKKEVVPVRK